MIQLAESCAFKCFINFLHYFWRFGIDWTTIIIFIRSVINLLLIFHLNSIALSYSISIHFFHTADSFLHSKIMMIITLSNVDAHNEWPGRNIAMYYDTIYIPQALHFLLPYKKIMDLLWQ